MAIEPILEMKYGWLHWDRDKKNVSRWSLRRKDNIFNLTLPSDSVLRKIYNQAFPESQYRPFHVLSRQKWGCIVATPKGVPPARRKKFLKFVAANRATTIT